MFTYRASRPAVWRRITWITALSAALAAFSMLGLSRLGSSAPSLATSRPASVPAPPDVGGVAAVAAQTPTRSVEVIVQFNVGVTPFSQNAIVAQVGGRVTRDLHVVNGLGVSIPAAAAEQLALDPRVRAVSLNAGVRSSDNGNVCSANPNPCQVAQNFVHSTHTDRAWSYGDTGAGVTVAVIDTGVADDMVDFRSSPSSAASRVVGSVAVNPAATNPYDFYGHGTHVAGLIAGDSSNRPASDPLGGVYEGTAPGANLVDVKVSDAGGNTSLIDVIYGLQFAVDHQADYNIRVVNLSLDSTVAQSYTTDPLDAAAEAAWNAGLVVVAAAGNLGTAPGAVSYAPANDPYVLTVGGVDDTQYNKTGNDVLASWSSRGTTQDGFAKPDVVAPGAHLISTLAPNSLFTQLCPGCATADGGYFQISGTSMAAAVASGMVADVIQAHPTWTPSQVKGALISTGVSTANGQAVAADTAAAIHAIPAQRVSDQGLTPSSLIDPTSGQIDYTRASWTRASWTRASWTRASWTRASWSCVCDPTGGSADPTRASWSRASWSRASWSSFLGDPVVSNSGSATSSGARYAIPRHSELEGSRWDLRWHRLHRRHAHRSRVR